MFSAGYDIGDLAGPRCSPTRPSGWSPTRSTAAIDAIEAYPYPTLAALNGHAIGGGLELALSCDLRIAAAPIKLAMPPAKLGLVYSHTGIRKFIDTIGAPRTRELFLVGGRIDAADGARPGGWSTRSSMPSRSPTRRVALAREIAANAPLAQRATSG